MKKVLSLFLVLVLTISLAACGANNVAETTPSPTNPTTQVTDDRGATVTIDSISKIVSLSPANTEILYALGVGDKVIAVSEYCNYPDDAQNKQKLPTGEKLNIESIIALDPDVIFMGKMSALDDQIKQMEEAGIKVVITEANNLTETYETIELMGKAAGKEKEAAEIVAGMKKSFDAIKEEVKGKTPVTVYVEVSPLQYGLWSCGKNTFVQELIDIVGAKNIFDDIEGWAAVSEEQVISRNPAIIITTASPLTGIEKPIEDITSRANWKGIDAIKNNKVIMLDADMISRPAPRLVDAAKELVKVLYK